ncbi:MAG TPA: hypothetical protein VG937_10220 [Polyangiaceae bacterium]|jgi:hypothetical protein|nr:hypothetical protein [Polyangiaceae bacterium]
MLQGPRSPVAHLTTAAVVLATSSAAPRATAEPAALATLELTRSSAAEHCIDARTLTRSVETRLARRAFADTAPLRLRVALDRRGPNWIAELSLSDSAGPLGERSLSTGAAHCSALDDSLALVVALLVGTPPERVEPAAAAPTVPAHAATPSAAPKTTQAATPLFLPADTWAPRAPWQFSGRAGGSLLFFALPGVAYGPSLGVAARPPSGPWLRLNADWVLPKEGESGDGVHGVRVSSERLGLLVCGLSLGAGSLEWQFCAGQRVGRVTAEGLGFDYSARVRRLYFAATLGGELTLHLANRWYLPVGLFAEIPLTRDQFVARDASEPLHRIGAVAGVLSAAIEFRGGS